MIIGTCGFGSTGSSVVSDYLIEYGKEMFSVMDRLEFTWVSVADGLIDLEYHLMHPHDRTSDSILAIQRYIKMMKRELRMYTVSGKIDTKLYKDCTYDFINSITQTKWKWEDLEGSSLYKIYFKHYLLGNKVLPYIERKIGKRINSYPFEEVNLSIMPSNFYDAAKQHVHDLLGLLQVDFSKPIVLDQPFSGNNPQAAFKFFDDPYAIVVDRDPRDIYVFSKTKLLGRNHFMPNDTVKDFVTYFLALREKQPYLESNTRILRLRFEDMVYNYDQTTKKLREFLHLGENPNPKSVFDPELSIANTQVYKRFPEYSKDIEYIESHLSEYLFDFSGYAAPKANTQMFCDKSPLHKKANL